MASSFNCERFEELLNRFRLLNPEQMDAIEKELIESGACDMPQAYSLTLATTESVISLYLESPVKRAERASFSKFFRIFTKTAKSLAAAADNEHAADTERAHSMSLVPAQHFDTLTWLRIEMASNVPDPVANAVAAGKRRNELLESVLEPLFRLILCFDRDAAIQWMLDKSGTPDTPVDPDVARDMVRAWNSLDTVPPAVSKKLLTWSIDDAINRHWPMVAAESDMLLRQVALKSCSNDMLPAGLRMLHPYNKSKRLLIWLKQAISAMGESITYFCDQAEMLTGEVDEADEWRRDSIFQELVQLQKQIRPLLIVSDLILSHPNGALHFAMAVFGFTDSYKKAWQKRLVEQCRKAVRRCFLRDLRLKRKPHDTIHTLSFGDADFEQQLLNELDLFTETFSTLEQREEVVDRLAHMYASYREEGLFMLEIGLRYRRMMRMLHTDNLNRLLSDEQQAAAGEFDDTLVELSSIAASSRKFITRRRALDRETEEMLAADIDYCLDIKSLRANEIRRILSLASGK